MSSTQRLRPLIAVIGSVDASREFAPPLKAVEQARDACRLLGAELARGGCDLAVFSSKTTYAEWDVIHGYAGACTADAPGRVAAFPPRHRDVDFALPQGSCVTLETVRDTSSEWEVAYYRRLLEADGVVLIGGGQSTRIAGIVALSQRIPVLPVAAFGGGAGQVWVNLDKVRNDTDDDDIALMGDNWQSDSAARLVACLLLQRTRRRQAEQEARRAARSSMRRASTGLVAAVLSLLGALALLVTAGSPGPATVHRMTVLVAAPLLASVAGALIRHTFETESGWLRAAVRGLGAGLVSVLLYCASQLLTVPALLEDLDVRRLLFFTVPLGFSAGFTFDLVFERLRMGGGSVTPGGGDPLAQGTQGSPGAPGSPP
ncbi:hypothetical protein ABZT28_34295 [Streptomyces sp. NPDC005388]|uniref:hypothetical protein n=1 Tax=Streptomyces sp. NPDC005388 TaxID=3156717 RepID=UPI0033BE6910